MNNVGSALARAIVLAGGAVLGALLARRFDDYIASRTHQQAEFDRNRYSQGLSAQQPLTTEGGIERIIIIEGEEE